jgi:diguanylate cyclase (GGDEF)-like protein
MASIVSRVENRLFGKHPFQGAELAWSLLRYSPEAIGAVSVEGRIKYLNPAAEKLLGISLREAQGRLWTDMVVLSDETGRNPFSVPPSAWTCPNVLPRPPAHLMLRRRGCDRPVQMSAAVIGDHAETPTSDIVIVMHDIADTHNLLLSLSYRCSHDHLTKLVNRAEFDKRLANALHKARHHGHQYALLYMDLDGFKAINDTYGHNAGDQVLTQLASCLRAAVRERDTLARLGGDEFGLLMENCSIEEAGGVARDLNAGVGNHSFIYDGYVLKLGVSIGVVGIDKHCQDITDVIRAADAACYLAKRERYNGNLVRHTAPAVSDTLPAAP